MYIILYYANCLTVTFSYHNILYNCIIAGYYCISYSIFIHDKAQEEERQDPQAVMTEVAETSLDKKVSSAKKSPCEYLHTVQYFTVNYVDCHTLFTIFVLPPPPSPMCVHANMIMCICVCLDIFIVTRNRWHRILNECWWNEKSGNSMAK